MENKKGLYIALGIGAGIVTYLILCNMWKAKQSIKMVDDSNTQVVNK
jgi:hypothetical protein